MDANSPLVFLLMLCIVGQFSATAQEISPKQEHTIGLRYSEHSGSGVFYQRTFGDVQARATAGGWWAPIIETTADLVRLRSTVTAGLDVHYAFVELPKLRLYAGIGAAYMYEYERHGCGFCPFDPHKPELMRTETGSHILRVAPIAGMDFIIARHLTITLEVSWYAEFLRRKALSFYTLETSPRVTEDRRFGFAEFAPGFGIGLGYRW